MDRDINIHKSSAGKNDSIGIYIHIPFCRSKCYYCDFNSYAGREHLAGSYFDALYREIMLRSRYIRDRCVTSIFIGGGTPSLVDPGYITKLIGLCREHFSVDCDAEISIESNPGTLTYEKLQAYRDAGVNRLSMGLQAWQDRILESIGRIHTVRQFAENLEAAVKCGFDNINVDLIFGLPGQTPEDWKETLEAVTGSIPAINATAGRGSPIRHISCYSLKIEEGTVFGDRLEAGLLEPADDALDREMYWLAVEMLAEKGYRHYEISNFAMAGYECRHNMMYWKAKEYAGFGAGAHSYLDGIRFSNVTGIEEYIRATGNVCSRFGTDGAYSRHVSAREERGTGPAMAGGMADSGTCPAMTYLPEEMERLHENIEVIDREEAMSEYMILGLRLTEGVSSEEFRDRFGESLEDRYGDKLDQLMARGLIETSGLEAGTGTESGTAGTNAGSRMADTRIERRTTGTSTGMVTAGTVIQKRTTGTSAEPWTDSSSDSYSETGTSKADHCSREIRYRLTRKGLDLANSVFVEFI